MFKRLEESWNDRTPVYLHPRTKENIIFQLILTVVFVGGWMTIQEWRDRREFKRLHSDTID